MDYDAVVGALRYAAGQDLPVLVTLRDGTTLAGVPTTVDTHPTAIEVYLRPAVDPETEVAISLAAISRVDLD